MLNRVLIGLLGLQILLIILVRLGGDPATLGKLEPLLPKLEPAAVARLEIYDADHADQPAVALVRRDEKWLVASHFDYPADAAAVTSLLGKLAGMASRGPTTVSQAAHEQLEVADDHFRRKLVVTDDEGDATTIYLGSSPRFRKISVRIAEKDQTHSVAALSASDAAVALSSWVDPVYVDIPVATIQSLALETSATTVAIERGEDGQWRLAGAEPTTTPLDAGKVKAVLDKVGKIALETVVGVEPQPSFGFDQPRARITVGVAAAAADNTDSPAAEEAVLIEIGARSGDRYYLRQLGRPYIVEVDAEAVDGLIDLSADTLAPADPGGEPGPPAPLP